MYTFQDLCKESVTLIPKMLATILTKKTKKQMQKRKCRRENAEAVMWERKCGRGCVEGEMRKRKCARPTWRAPKFNQKFTPKFNPRISLDLYFVLDLCTSPT